MATLVAISAFAPRFTLLFSPLQPETLLGDVWVGEDIMDVSAFVCV